MDLFTLVAKLTMDSSEYEKGIKKSKQSFMGLANTVSARAVAVGTMVAHGIERAAGALIDFGKNVLFTNPPCDELIVLPAEVENENFFMIILHADAFFYLKIISSLLGPFETILTEMPSSFSMKRT